jgi:hypothetical protein
MTAQEKRHPRVGWRFTGWLLDKGKKITFYPSIQLELSRNELKTSSVKKRHNLF